MMSDEWYEDEYDNEGDYGDEDEYVEDTILGEIVNKILEEEIIEEQYVNEENDLQAVNKVTEDEKVVEEEKIEDFDKVYETIRCKIANLTNHDHMMEEKVLDSLRRGLLR